MPELTETARFAIEEVCSGRRLDDLDHWYAPNFVDHVNAMEHRGHDGVRESVGLYKRIFDDLSFTTEQQLQRGIGSQRIGLSAAPTVVGRSSSRGL